MNVFISGSRSILKLDENIINELFSELNSNEKILIGDSDGIDAVVQQFFAFNGYKNVLVFTSNNTPRNNLGNFAINPIKADKKHYGRAFYEEKDKAMTFMADYGVAIWDGKSKGTLNNINRLIKQNKPCNVYIYNQKKWVFVDQDDTLAKLQSPQLSFF